MRNKTNPGGTMWSDPSVRTSMFHCGEVLGQIQAPDNQPGTFCSVMHLSVTQAIFLQHLHGHRYIQIASPGEDFSLPKNTLVNAVGMHGDRTPSRCFQSKYRFLQMCKSGLISVSSVLPKSFQVQVLIVQQSALPVGSLMLKHVAANSHVCKTQKLYPCCSFITNFKLKLAGKP